MIQNQTVAVLDIGSSKVCCLIANIVDGEMHIMGLGHHQSHGIKNGMITDIEAATYTILQTVGEAEEKARTTIDTVTLVVGGAHIQSHTLSKTHHIAGDTVTKHDMSLLFRETKKVLEDNERIVLHSIPIQYELDDNNFVEDPLGLYAKELTLHTHIITGQKNHIRNIVNAVHRCHLKIEHCIVSSFASALSSLVDDEKNLGSILIDIGAGTTSIAYFSHQKPLYTTTLPIGGSSITNDIARGLGTPLTSAEKVKILHGNLMTSSAEAIATPSIGEEGENTLNIPLTHLNAIIKPRTEEILELILETLKNSNIFEQINERIILTGGASQMVGLREMASRIISPHVRYGKPYMLYFTQETEDDFLETPNASSPHHKNRIFVQQNLGSIIASPSFSACVGGLLFLLSPYADLQNNNSHIIQPPSIWGRLKNWVKSSF